jgi:hypothetical protein
MLAPKKGEKLKQRRDLQLFLIGQQQMPRWEIQGFERDLVRLPWL